MLENLHSETANVEALMDSVFAIEQALNMPDDEIKLQILKANSTHIDFQLGKQVYQSVLTESQIALLVSASARAKEVWDSPAPAPTSTPTATPEVSVTTETKSTGTSSVKPKR